MKKLLRVVGFIFLALIAIGIFASRGTTTTPSEATASTNPPSTPATTPTGGSATTTEKKPDLELLDHKPESGDFGVRYITGTVKNNSKKTYSYVQVEINLYDDAGAQVGNTVDNTTNLDPGGTWRFRAINIESKATKYKIMKVSGF